MTFFSHKWSMPVSVTVLIFALVGGYYQVAAQSDTPPFQPDPDLYQRVCANPSNPVAQENCQPGTDDWIVDVPGEIEGYTSLDSVNIGDSLDFFVNTSAASYDLMIYRLGYYGGLGGRLVQTFMALPGNRQPACIDAADTGLVSCSNWSVSHSITIPGDWVSGVYVGKLVRTDGGGANYVLFVVRDDNRKTDILYQQSFATYHTTNSYGGKTLYESSSNTCLTVTGTNRAVKVSFNRPSFSAMADPTTFFRAEFGFVRWLEAQGYDVSYSTTQDTHRSGKPGEKNHLLDHQVFLEVGHDEYWSQEMRDAITAARDAGVHIGIFSGNTGYWRVRFEPDPITGEPDSVMVSYKTTIGGPPDPSGNPTTTWRDPSGANDPEATLLGAQYIGANESFYFPLRVTAEQAKDPTFRHTGLDQMPPNTYINVGEEIVGWEWDALPEPPPFEGIHILAASPVVGHILTDKAGDHHSMILKTAAVNTVRYTASSGAIVFNTGTIQWAWGLGARSLKLIPPDPIITQVTYNVLADMGAQPATPDTNLILDGGTALQTLAIDPSLFIAADRVQPPTITDVQAVANGQEVTIIWETDIDSIGQVFAGLHTGPQDETGGRHMTYGRVHSVTLSDLLPATTYYYRVTAVSRDWEIALSDEQVFETTNNLPLQARNAALPVLKQANCWVRANPTQAIVMGAVVGVVGLTILWRRRKPAQG